MILLYLSVIFFTFSSIQAQDAFITIPEQKPGEDKIYVEANVGDEDVSIYCRLVDNSSTTWEIDNTVLAFDAIDGSSNTPAYDYLHVTNDLVFEANLTFTTAFMKSYDRLEVVCKGGTNETRTFLIGIPAPPQFDNASAIYKVVEGQPFSLDLSSPSDPFPPVNIRSAWTINGMTYLSPQTVPVLGLILDTYSFTIASTHRDMTGIAIQANVSNDHGFDVRTFTFNIQYPTEGNVSMNNTIVPGALNGTAKLTAHIESLKGNPTPNITWIDPNGNEIAFPNDRFSSDVDNVLNIDSIQSSDYGQYLFIADNGIGEKLTLEITLDQAFEPDKPEALSINAIGSQFASIQWNAPSYKGYPALTEYEIELTSDSMTKTTVTDMTMLLVEGLDPGTVYIVTVKAISEVFPDGGDTVTTTFETDQSRVELKGIDAINEEGSIIVNYELHNTGGYDKEIISVEVTCNRNDSPKDVTGSAMGSGSADLSNTCSSDCFDEGDGLKGSLTVSDSVLIAGDVYDCTVHVTNPLGSVPFRTTPITLITGKPSIPVLKIETSDDTVELDMRTEHAGIGLTNDTRSYFAFHVTVVSSAGRVVYNETFSVPGYKTNSTVTKTLEGISGSAGDYSVLVSASNEYGESDAATLDFTIVPLSTTSPPNTRPPSGGNTNAAVIAAAVAVPLVAALSVALIIVIILLVVWKKKKRGQLTITQNVKVQPIEVANEKVVASTV